MFRMFILMEILQVGFCFAHFYIYCNPVPKHVPHLNVYIALDILSFT